MPLQAYLETSAINRLILDAENEPLRQALLSTRLLSPVVGGASISEILGTSKALDLRRLLDFCGLLLVRGRVVDPPGEILESVISGLTGDGRDFSLEGPSAELIRRAVLLRRKVEEGTKLLALRMKTDTDATFEDIVRGVCWRLSLSSTEEKTLAGWLRDLFHSNVNLERLLEAHRVPGSSRSLAIDLVRRADPRALPLRAAMLAEWTAVYIRCLRKDRTGRHRATGVDLTHGIYLACCDVFITGDDKAVEMYETIAANLPARPRVVNVRHLGNLIAA